MGIFCKLDILKLVMLTLLFQLGRSYYQLGATKIRALALTKENKVERLHATGPFASYHELEEMNDKINFITEPTTTLTAFSEPWSFLKPSEQSIIASLTVSPIEMISRSDLMGSYTIRLFTMLIPCQAYYITKSLSTILYQCWHYILLTFCLLYLYKPVA